MLEVQLLGGFQVRRDGGQVSWPNAKTKALFQILMGQRGRFFSKDQLIEWLFPDTENLKSAEANLRGRVRELRLLLEPGLKKGSESQYILTRREGYCFNPQADCRIDIEEFARHLREGEKLLREGLPGEALAAFEKAVQLYQGPYLPEVPYEDWALENRGHWQEEYLRALERLADLNVQLGHFAEARARCRQILEREPCRETAWRQLMRLHATAGERAEALRVYERCREVLKRELGMEPSPATRALYESLRQGRPLPEIEEAPPPEPAKVLVRELPLVGRQWECRRLLERLAQTRAGRGGLVLILGEAGVGKTRLAQEIINELDQGKWQVLVGCCPQLEAPPALMVLAEAIRAGLAAGILDAQVLKELPPAWAAELAELVPELTLHLPGLPALPSLPPEWKRLRLFEALTQLFLKLAAQKPLLLFLDDLHAADSSTLDWLKMFLPRAQKAPLLVLATARAEEVEEALSILRQEGRRHGWFEELPLKRLDSDAVWELAQALSHEPELAQLLFKHTQGNPFFIVALLGLLTEQGLLRSIPKERRWRLATTRLERVELLPAEVQELLRRRLDHLSQIERELLYLSSVFGLSVPTTLLWKAWGEQAFSVLEGLLRKQLLVEQGEEIAFVHELLRETAYAEMSEARRRAFHGRAAHALEATHAAPAVLFHHYIRSDERVRALDPGLQALHQASRTYQNEEALQLSQKLLELLESLAEMERPKGELAFQIHLERFDILGLLGRRSDQEQELQELFALAGQLGRRQQAQGHRRQALLHEATGRLREAQQDAKRALELAPDEAEQAECQLLLGNLALDMGDLAQARAHYQGALQLYESKGDRRGQAQAMNNLGIVHYYLGDYDQAQTCYERALGLSRQLNEQREIGKILNNLGDVYGMRGDWKQAQACLGESARIRREIGDRRGELITLANLGEFCVRRGEPKPAREHLAQAVQLAVDLQLPILEAAVRARLAWAELVQGQIKFALSESQRALSFVEGGQAAEFAPEIYYRAFQVFDAAGQSDKATQALQKAHEELQRRAQALPESFRTRFLEGVLPHREILQAYQERLRQQN